MEEIKVSVIIPVYNTQEFVREAVQSITGQSLHEIEVVVVDDGSTDGSPAILRELAAADPRIRIFTQPNQGQSGARNLGLDNARGEYIYFMDSDDLLRPDALETCYDKCRARDLDLVAFDADIFGDSDGVFSPDFYHRTAGMEDKTYRGIELMGLMMDQHRFRVPIWLSVIRRSFLECHGLRFIPGSTHEDELFTALCYMQAARAGVIPQAFFRRRVRGSSTMTTRFAWRNMDSYFRVTDELVRFAELHGSGTWTHIPGSQTASADDQTDNIGTTRDSDSTDTTLAGTDTQTGIITGSKGADSDDSNNKRNGNENSPVGDNVGTTNTKGDNSGIIPDSVSATNDSLRMAYDHSYTPDGSEIRDTVDRFLFRMLNPAVCRAHVMPLADRLRIARLCLTRYSNYIKPRTLAVLLLKGPLDKITGRR